MVEKLQKKINGRKLFTGRSAPHSRKVVAYSTRSHPITSKHPNGPRPSLRIPGLGWVKLVHETWVCHGELVRIDANDWTRKGESALCMLPANMTVINLYSSASFDFLSISTVFDNVTIELIPKVQCRQVPA